MFLLTGGEIEKYKTVAGLTRGEALHWMLMMAKKAAEAEKKTKMK